jgi:hypothetical protein
MEAAQHPETPLAEAQAAEGLVIPTTHQREQMEADCQDKEILAALRLQRLVAEMVLVEVAAEPERLE